MKGIDTNILVRFYIQDDPEQHGKVTELFRQASTQNLLFINHVVLIEWFWVLTQVYDVAKKDIVKELEYLLSSKEIALQNSAAVRKSLEIFKAKNVDFTDCLIALLNSKENCETTYTFDKNASKLSSFSLLD